MDSHVVSLKDRKIGGNRPAFLIAEAGINHNGSLKLAKKLVDAAHAAGVDAVKFQTFNVDQVISKETPKAAYQKSDRDQENMYEMVKKFQMSPSDMRSLAQYCEEKGILFLSTPFDNESVDLLDELGVPLFKIGSGDLNNHLFLDYVASKNKPILLSTGMATLSEISSTIKFLDQIGPVPLALFHCVSSYPTPVAECHLRAIQTLSNQFNLPVGWSDHTLGHVVACGAVAIGAQIIEKHFTLDKSLEGPDHLISLDPRELTQMVKDIRDIEAALGKPDKKPQSCEVDVASVARRSLFAAHDLKKGHTLTKDDLISLRPGWGIPPSQFTHLVGKRLKESINGHAMISLEHLERH